MSTYVVLKNSVEVITQEYNVDTVNVLRNVENYFIENTNCTEELLNVLSSTMNEGVLAALYDLPEDFIREYRVEWNGIKLDRNSKATTEDRIYNYENVLRVGTPTDYLIEDNQIRLMPKPTSHNYLNIWYCKKNTSLIGTSPIIPAQDHTKLVNGAIEIIFRIKDNDTRADRYKKLFERDLKLAYQKYSKQRFGQSHIVDGSGDHSYESMQNRIPLVEG